MPIARYSSIRAATSSGEPTSAVPAPPRTRPTPAQRFGLTTSLSRRPPCSALMRLCPTESMRAKTDLRLGDGLRRRDGAISRSAAAQASSDVSRTMTCRRMPKLSLRPCLRVAALTLAIFSATSAGGSPQVRYLSTVSAATSIAFLRRAAEIERRMRRLHRRKEQLPAFDADVLAGDVDRLAGEQRLVGMQELAGDLVALGMADEDAVALVLDRVAAGDDVDQQAPVRQPVEGRGHARRDRRRLQARPHRDEEASRSVEVSIAEATIQESSQLFPVGSSTPK